LLRRGRNRPAGRAATVNAALARLQEAGILREVTGRRRGRIFLYESYLDLLQADR
jgi:DNA-binding transcriptional ArsR family regulator